MVIREKQFHTEEVVDRAALGKDQVTGVPMVMGWGLTPQMMIKSSSKEEHLGGSCISRIVNMETEVTKPSHIVIWKIKEVY